MTGGREVTGRLCSDCILLMVISFLSAAQSTAADHPIGPLRVEIVHPIGWINR